MTASASTVLWWGRFDPDYSRNRIIRKLFGALGWQVVDFRPALSRLGGLEARFRGVQTPDLVWLPCFRQRDAGAAIAWARSKGVPIIFDPLISAYDKQVFERRRMVENSARAGRLLAWEGDLFRAVDLLFADTWEHLSYFANTMGVAEEKLAVLPVGAEESLFFPASPRARAGHPPDCRPDDRPVEVLFYGSFIGLQGPECIVEAARIYEGPPVTWHLLGEGPLLTQCKAKAVGLANVVFEPWVDYDTLPARIHRADILLGVFGMSVKAGRVIPNKVYQALACGRPVITRVSDAYPKDVRKNPDSGLFWVAPDSAGELAKTVAELASDPESLADRGTAAAETYAGYFSNRAIGKNLAAGLERLGLAR